ncbi:Integrase catalytic region (fragment) [Candidatus Accumulibacter aalborgensis]|uniref:Integrase catalytic region n=1 Tax=Candidatus Accumulibacter aalborgensis TaxID=1860102 RepID=A0A1A8XJW3_9PROT
MNETRLCAIEQIEQFLSASASIEFSATGDDSERMGTSVAYSHALITLGGANGSGACCTGTCSYSRAQVMRLVTRWHRNRLASVPMAKGCSRP